MMVTFRPDAGLIVIRATLTGPGGDTIVRLALDTGATRTLIVPSILSLIGCDPSASSEFRKAATVSGVEYAPLVQVNMVEAIGHRRENLSVLCQSLPANVGVDGLLGLDFLRGMELNIDFRMGKLSLT